MPLPVSEFRFLDNLFDDTDLLEILMKCQLIKLVFTCYVVSVGYFLN